MATQLLIDGHSLLYRAYHALPALATTEGIPTGAVHGFFSMLLKVAEAEHPDRVVVVFDAPAKTFRHEQYAEYKANRPESPEDFRQQVTVVQDLLKALEIPVMAVPGYEADDVIGTLAELGRQRHYLTKIVTGDRDLLQLVDDGVEVLLTSRTGITDVDRMTPEAVREKMGVEPKQVPDLKGLMGDASDNIPGVAGIGQKSALALLGQFGTVENLLRDLGQITNTRWKKALLGHESEARQSRDLATIVVDAPVTWPTVAEPFRLQSSDTLNQLLDRYQLAALRRRVASADPNTRDTSSSIAATAPTGGAKKTGIVIAGQFPLIKDRAFVIWMDENDQPWIMDPVLRQYMATTWAEISKTIMVWAWGSKEMMRYAVNHGFEPPDVMEDGKIQAYLLNSELSRYGLYDIAALHGYSMSSSPEHVLPLIEVLIQEQSPSIEEKQLRPLYRNVEIPLIVVLARMEATGINVDADRLRDLGRQLKEAILSLQDEIYQLAGTTFNINSPSQLGDILFNKLNLPTLKKTKTGYSTDAETLEELAPLHPLVDKVLLYRQHMKIQGTYVDGLLPLIAKDGRVHTTFHQTVAATGRLSSSDPNLQNIPVRLPLGRQVRAVFIPSQGRRLLAADYSQIELRMLAHLSGDENLIAAFVRGEDIHQRTAAEIFGLPIDQVDAVWRNRAKAVNFGIVYGISDFGLARDTGVSRAEAKEYIAKYFARYPRLKEYFEGIIQQARQTGQVSTIMGRIRPLPDIHAANRAKRQYAERMAMNTVIQGSAADLIKVAMIRIQNVADERQLKSRMVLQVHDELIWDAEPSEVEILSQEAENHMVHALSLKVPLVVEFKIGDNWENMVKWERTR
ncbi:MAG: DNA polymerase I [Sulfobacillus sp.]